MLPIIALPRNKPIAFWIACDVQLSLLAKARVKDRCVVLFEKITEERAGQVGCLLLFRKA